MTFAGDVIAKSESSGDDGFTIRHVNCEVIVAGGDDASTARCSYCTHHRKALSTMVRRSTTGSDEINSKHLDALSHTNYRFLTSPEKVKRLQILHREVRITQKKLFRLREKLEEKIATQAILIDEDTDADMRTVMAEEEGQLFKRFPEGFFQRLFWEEQKKAAAKKNMCEVHWHPLMIKFCLYLRHQSPKGYETLRDSGCIRLPSQRTLRDYSHAVKAEPGFSPEVDHQLMVAADVIKSKEWEKLVVILLDEMYIKEDLVYEKHSGNLIGFANLGEVKTICLPSSSLSKLKRTLLVVQVHSRLPRQSWCLWLEAFFRH